MYAGREQKFSPSEPRLLQLTLKGALMNQAAWFSSASFPRTTAFNFMHRAFVLMVILVLQLNIAMAQQQPQQQQPAGSQQTQVAPAQPVQTSPPADQKTSPSATVTLPAGTKLQLGLLRALSVKKTKPGDSAYLQVTFPVSAGSQMLIPPGTYLQPA